MTRRDIIDQFPGKELADDFFMYGEDVQWCYAVRKLGYKVWYTPEAKAYHYLSASSPEIKEEKEKYYSKILPNNFRLMQKEKGTLYTYTFYFVRVLLLYSLRTSADRKEAWRHLRFLARDTFGK